MSWARTASHRPACDGSEPVWADGWRAWAQRQPRAVHTAVHHLEQGVEVDAVPARQHEDVAIAVSSQHHAGVEQPPASPASTRPRPLGRVGDRRHQRRRPQLQRQRDVRARRRARPPSGSAPSPGSSRPCSASSRSASRVRAGRLGRRVGHLEVRQQPRRHAAKVVGRAARAGQVQRVDEDRAVRLADLRHDADGVGERRRS